MSTLWTDTAQMPRFSKLQHDERADVLVVGGGLAGLLCAYRLQQAGLSVIVAEAGRVAGGVTARTTAKLTAQHGGDCYRHLIRARGEEVAAAYRRAQEEAFLWFDTIAEEIPCDAETVDAYLYACRDVNRLWCEEEAIRRTGGAVERVDENVLPFACEGALRLPRQRQFHPLKLAAGLSERLTVYENTAIRSLRDQTAVTEDGMMIYAQHTVVATHFPFIDRHGWYPLKLHQERSYVLTLEGVPPLAGMLIDNAPYGINWRQYKQHTLISGTGHRTGKEGVGWQLLENAVKQRLPDAVITRRWATQDCFTADAMPYIGAYGRGTPNWLVVTGFNGWGMSGSLLAAQAVADRLVKHTQSPLFSPQRGVPKSPLLTNVRESLWGIVTPKRPRCTHLGCALHWNPWEHTWDCACHGSRFSADGKRLNGPAAEDLTKKPVKGDRP